MYIKQELDDLAGRIRREISEAGICNLHQRDFEIILGKDHQLNETEKRLRVENFSRHYGFIAAVRFDLERIIFRN